MTKTIAGPLAGHQQSVTIHVVCNGAARSPNFVIASRVRAGSVSHSFDDIPAGSVCTVTETADGATATVTANVSGNRQNGAVPAGKVVPVSLTDVYQARRPVPESHQDISGPAAASTVASPSWWPAAVRSTASPSSSRPIPRTGSVSRYFDGLPAGSRCTVAEVAVGHTGTVTVVAIRRRQKMTIRANRTATAHLTDIFTTTAPVTG